MTPSCVERGRQGGRLRRIAGAAARVGVQRLGQAEVQHLDRALARELDVLRFQVAMDDAALVRRLERFGNLQRDRQRLFERNPSGGDAVREAPSVDELEHQDRRVSAGPAMSSMPWIAAMFGWLSAASTRASRSNRDRRSGS